MSKTSDKQLQLVATLKELFMMDQADLDFGIYRIMNAKHNEIESFLHNDLLPTIQDTLQSGGKGADVQKELDELIKTLQEAGVNPDDSPKVKDLKALLGDGANNNLEKDEAEIFSHLTTFFSRYYDGGDFMSLRRYKQETYSPLPMNGEEVKLHWANADQYYIKSAESFSNYAFKVGEGGDGDKKKTIRFELVQASTEQNNKKETTDKERRFILDENQPVSLRQKDEGEELILHFNYQADTDKRKQKDLNLAAIDFIREFDGSFDGSDAFTNKQVWQSWQTELLALKPTDKNKKRTVLEKYLMDYTAKNSFDYFIHKDLGGFLKRELNFFIKNELLLLDDIVPDNGDAIDSQLLSNERSLKKIIAFKAIAQKLIAFLAQLENFQKKLWLKKKFVLESNYCMTLDRVPEAFYAEIAGNQAQIQEWVDLGFIDKKTTKDTKVTKKDLKENPFLLIDTGLFGEDFKLRLLAEIDDLDETTDGLLIHSENFQALNLMQERYREQVKCVYIDPPYNTEQDRAKGKFVYKDNYDKSSWATLLSQRFTLASNLMKEDAPLFVSIDHNEVGTLKFILEEIFNKDNFEGLISWRRRHNQPNDKSKMIGMVSEYILSYAKNSIKFKSSGVGKLDITGSFSNPDKDIRGDWASKPWKVGSDQSGSKYTITTPTEKTLEEEWMGDENTYKSLLNDGRIYFPKNGGGAPRKKYYKSEREEEGQCATNWWQHDAFGHNQGANDLMTSLFGYKNAFSNPKPIELIRGILLVSKSKKNFILDYFSGSGTTGHATINLNREDKGNRKYILVEMGEYFDTVLKPRIKKVVYSKGWRDGKPLADKENSFNGISHCFKYIRLESYEDVVDNLQLQRTEQQADLLNNPDNKTLKEDYLLNYMLDIEVKGSLFSRDLFIDPFNAEMHVVRDNESREQAIDLVETFNYLLGLRVESTRKQQGIVEVIGKSPADESVHIIWRNVAETDNDALDDWFRKQSYNTRDMEFDRVYVNGDNNLPNLRTSNESWKVQLIEEAFETLMFDCQDV